MTSNITHAIFDLNGTIIDSIDAVKRIFRTYAESKGKELTNDITKKIGETESLNALLEMFVNSMEPNVDYSSKMNILADLNKQIWATSKFKLVPGVEKLIEHLHINNIPMAIATNISYAQMDCVEEKFDEFFEKYFTHIVCGDDVDVKYNKPKPDIYHVCANRFEVKPNSVNNCIIFEDSYIGICGAISTGMNTVLINDRKYHNFAALEVKITKIIDAYTVFRPESVGLPAYK